MPMGVLGLRITVVEIAAYVEAAAEAAAGAANFVRLLQAYHRSESTYAQSAAWGPL